MTRTLAWLTIFRRALLAGAALGLALSLAFVLPADSSNSVPDYNTSRVGSSATAGATARSGSGRESAGLDGSAVRATALLGKSSQLADDAATPEATPTNPGQRLERRSEDDVARTAKVSPTANSDSIRALAVPRGAPLTVDRDAQDVELAVTEAAREFGQDPAVMLCVARAESTLRANVLGHAGERGPMQFMPRTWGYYERGPDGTARWTGNSAALNYGEQDVWLAIPAARVAASMFAAGQAWQWTTSAGCAK